LGVSRSDTIKLEELITLRLEHSPSTMVSAAGKSSSSSKRKETSKPEEKVEEPVKSLSVPLKEVTVKTAKAADKALAWILRATRALQHEPVAVLESGMFRLSLYSDGTDTLTHLMPRSSTLPHQAISKFRIVYEQIEGEPRRWSLMGGLWEIALFAPPTDDATRRERYIDEEMGIVMWLGPISQLGCRKRLLYNWCCGLYIPGEWRKQVKELIVALKALTNAQASLMFWRMLQLLDPRRFHRLSRSRLPLVRTTGGKEEWCEKTKATDSDFESTESGSYSTG
jgi:hypothetical protein